MISIRSATVNDVETLCSLDLIARKEEERREFIRHSVADNTCLVAVSDQGIIGYGVLNYSFYHLGCVDMLYVADGQRQRGVGATLLNEMERLCKTQKLFTSTNQSNLPMQSLLTKSGYVPSGIINNLDDGDPEIVYFKRIR